MFGSLKKKLKEITKKFSKTEETVKETSLDEMKIEEEIKIEAEPIKEIEKVVEKPHKHREKVAENEIKIEKIKEEEKPKEKEIEKEEKKPGFLKKLTKRVAEKDISEDDIDKILPELNKALLESDVAYPVAEKICDDVKASLIGKAVKRGKTEDEIKSALQNAMLDVMSQQKIDVDEEIHKKKPFLIVFLGFNGTGKTTTIAKLAHKLKKKTQDCFCSRRYVQGCQH